MIDRIEIRGLFGRFNYDVKLSGNGITLLTGPNGFGKSTMFALIEALCKGNRAVIADTYFSSLTLTKSTGEIHVVEKMGDRIAVDGQTLTFGEFVAGKECTALDAIINGSLKAETVGSRRFLDGALKSDGELKKYVDFIKSIPSRVEQAYEDERYRQRVLLLVDLLKEKLTFKMVDIDDGRLSFTDESGKKLDFTDLSAGEIQLCVFYAELLFDAKEDVLLMIDEPEMSMHIVWQFSLVDEIERICAITGASAVIATHSPQVLNGHFDLQVDLGEQYGR